MPHAGLSENVYIPHIYVCIYIYIYDVVYTVVYILDFYKSKCCYVVAQKTVLTWGFGYRFI